MAIGSGGALVAYELAVMAAVPQTVNTTINWPGLAISLGTFIASMAAILAYIDRRSEKRQAAVQQNQDQLRREVHDSIENLAKILTERLETKENVNNLKVEVAKMSEQMRLAFQDRGSHGATLWQ